MNIAEIFEEMKIKHCRFFFTKEEVSEFIKDKQVESVFISKYSRYIISEPINVRDHIATVVPPYIDMMKLKSVYRMVNGDIVFIVSGKISHRISSDLNRQYPHKAVYYYEGSVLTRFCTSKLSTCMQLILFSLIDNK